MKHKTSVFLSAAILIVALFGTPAASMASTLTYSNTSSSVDGICCFGASGSFAYGEVFALTQSVVLDSWDFYSATFSETDSGNVELALAVWNGSEALTPFYTSPVQAFSGVASAITFNDINESLTAGTSYIAYLTAVGVPSPMFYGELMLTTGTGASTAGGIGETWAYTNSTNFSAPWTYPGSSPTQAENFEFQATVSAVPVSATVWLMVIGLLGLGALTRKHSAL